MKDFEALTQRGQLRRIHQVAGRALEAFGQADATRISLLDHGENTTFRARVAQPLEPRGEHLSSDSLLVRCHRPGYNTSAVIESELMWLEALHEAGVAVQLPLRDSDGRGVIQVDVEGVPGGRQVSVLRWAQGSMIRRSKTHHMKHIGALTAQLHEHAVGWEPPAGFERPRIDMQQRFNVSEDLSAADLVARMTPRQAQTHQRASAYVRGIYDMLDEQVLIHADLHMGNMVFAGGQARPIDFDDCGMGPLAYDFAVALMSWYGRPDFDARVEAFVQGYTARAGHAPDLTHMEDMIIARTAEMCLWLIDRARSVQSIRDNLDAWMSKRIERLEQMLDKRRAPA